MLKAILGTLSGIALIAFTYLCITLALAVKTNSKHVANVLMDLATTTESVNATLKTINAPKTGTIAQLDGALQDVRLTVAHSDRILTKEGKSIDAWDAKISETLGNVNTSVQALTDNENKITEQTGQVLTATTESVKSVKPLVDNLTTEAKDLQTTTQALNEMVPDIKATAKNVNGMTADGKETTAMAKDWLHGILHPTWPTRIKNAMLDVLQHLPVP